MPRRASRGVKFQNGAARGTANERYIPRKFSKKQYWTTWGGPITTRQATEEELPKRYRT